MTSRSDAVHVALRYTTWPHAMCAAFVQKVYDHGWVGASAIDAWNRARHKHTSYPPPAGVPCYWAPKGRNPYGHIAVSLGGGRCRSSDYPSRGRVGTVDIRWIETHWPNTGRYLGWSDDIAGVLIGGASPSPPATHPHPTGDWFDMATKDELRDVVREMFDAYAGAKPMHNSALGQLLTFVNGTQPGSLRGILDFYAGAAPNPRTALARILRKTGA